jgi:phage terminase large subunit
VPAFLPLYTDDWEFFFAWGGRGGAKSIQIADFLIMDGSRQKLKILCTREVQRSIKQSVHSLLKERIIAQGRESEWSIYTTYMMHKVTGTEIIFSGLQDHTVDSIKSFQGVDRCWVEEAHSVSKHSLDILLPTIVRKPGYKLLFSYNRYAEVDPCHSVALSMLTDHKNLKFVERSTSKNYTWTEYRGTGAVGIFINGRTGNPKWNDGLEADYQRYKKDDPETLEHVYNGEPVSQQAFSCISRKSVLEAIERVLPKESGNWYMGLDVARFGADKTVIYLRRGNTSVTCKAINGSDTVDVCSLVDSVVKDHNITTDRLQINVDDTGVGGGVSDQLHKLYSYNVNRINFGNKAIENDKYDIVASELWFSLKERLNEVSLLDIKDLKDELTSRRWKMDKNQRRVIESKDTFKKRYKKSPDYADACVLCFYVHAHQFSAGVQGLQGLTAY